MANPSHFLHIACARFAIFEPLAHCLLLFVFFLLLLVFFLEFDFSTCPVVLLDVFLNVSNVDRESSYQVISMDRVPNLGGKIFEKILFPENSKYLQKILFPAISNLTSLSVNSSWFRAPDPS